jgi:signal transduction histidine kinase/ligand-binding sensor domain-containing protein
MGMFCRPGPLSCFGGGADLTGEFAIETWTAENGLPHNSVTALLQRRNGYIWSGSFNGIAQFDGENFKVFTSSNTRGLRNSRITCLYEDPQGVAWIGHDTGEVTRCTGERFEPVPVGPFLGNGPVLGFGNDEAGDLWVLNLRGEVLRLRDSWLLKPPPLMAEEPSVAPELVADGARRLYVLRNGVAARITPTGYQEEKFGSTAARPYHARLTRARTGGLWVAGENWVRKWDGQKWEKDFGPFPWGDSFVTTMLETSSHRVLIGTLLGGLYVLNESGGWFRLSRTNGLSQDWIRCLVEDREHNVWVGTSGGLVLLRERKVVMHDPPDNWAGRPVMAITQARDGAVWAATEGAGLYRLATSNSDAEGKAGGTWMQFGVPEGLANLFVWSVLEDSQRRVWAGTWGGGLFQLAGGKFARQFTLAELSAPVTALMESPPGTLWIGTGAGLMRYADGKLEPLARLGGAAAGAVRALEAGAPGEIWLGTQGAGLGCVRKGECLTYPRADSLPGDSILSLHYDAGGVLWIGTLEKGVCRFKAGRFAAVTTEHGLPNNTIDHIDEDSLGNFWFNSQTGLFRVSRQELEDCADGQTNALRALAFGKAEGMTTLAGSGGFTPSGFRAADGRLWFPTTRGLAVVNPASVRPNQIPPPVLIEEILVDGHRVEVRPQPAPRAALRNPSDRPPPARGIEVPPGRRQLDIKFTGLSFTSPSRVQFKHQLEGLDPDWIEGGTRRQVTYSYLPPGGFTFRVIACNSDGLWNEAGDAINIMVRPEPWQTWWFKTTAALAAGALVGGSVFLAARRRMRRKLERLARAHELERERARIAQDIHDDLGASLTRIGMLSESAAGDWQHPQEAIASLKQIQTTTRELTRAMDEIVWAVNPRHDTLDSLTDYISRFAQDFLGTAQIRCRLALPLQIPDCSVRSEVRHNLFLAFKETLHNAVKHSGANEVRISLQLVPGGFMLAVADNGSGFGLEHEVAGPERSRPAPGNGLGNIRSRLAQIQGRAEIHSALGEGTRVELFVPMPDLAATTGRND